ncbi:NACHT domain-containing protein [Marinobacter sp. BGYM27]|uniref:NACHT domain-containing protein n=1 Tax=Marinobacter sp. BGYM27 TaxID=2975597 RepID=UPI0021A29BD5|nr:NACHT domain-containing protein [Marinobacter sp. BGYM27]MDG5500345.1 NACHT domain-containing protein [Marinobacter sp. BGYM27]
MIEALSILLSNLFESQIAGALFTIISITIFTLLLFPIIYKKYHLKYRNLEVAAQLYASLLNIIPSRGSIINLNKHTPDLNPFKFSIDPNKIDEDRVEMHGYPNSHNKIYIKPDVIKISSHDLEAEQHMMSLRDDTDIMPIPTPSIEDLVNQVELSSKKTIFIRGAAGFGKSNLCTYISNHFYENSPEVFKTIYSIDATDISINIDDNENLPLVDYLLFQIKKYRLSITIQRCIEEKSERRNINKKLISWKQIQKTKTERCLLIVDGIDELKDIKKRDSLLEFLESFIPKNNWRVLITGRPSSFREWKKSPISNSIFFDLLPFKDSQIEELSFNIYSLITPQKNVIKTKIKTRDFVRRITNNTTIELASNPLFLTLMVQLDASDRKLPNNKPELINEIVKEIIERRSPNEDIKYRDRMEEILTELAYLTIIGKSNLEIKEKINKSIDNSFSTKTSTIGDYWDALSFFDKSGLIIREDNLGFRFINRCYLEYLSSKYLYRAQNNTNFFDIINIALSYENTEIFFYLTYHINDPDRVFNSITESEKELKKSLAACIDLYCYSQAKERKPLSIKYIDRLKESLKTARKSNHKNFDELMLYMKFNSLRFSDPLSKSTLSFNEATCLINLDKNKNSKNGKVVGLNPKQIQELLYSINRVYADSRGHFSLPTALMAKDNIKDDSIIFKNNNPIIYNSESLEFKKIKLEIRANADELKNEILKKADRKNPLSESYFKSIPSIFDIIFNVWSPNILITNNEWLNSDGVKEIYIDFCNDHFSLIRDQFFGDPNFRAKLQREFSVVSLFIESDGYSIDKKSIENFNYNFENLLHTEIKDIDKIKTLIIENLIIIYISLQSNSGIVHFSSAILSLARLFTMHSLLGGKTSPWGHIRVAYIPNVRGSSFTPREDDNRFDYFGVRSI